MRTCNECTHKQGDKKPDGKKDLTNAYMFRKCKKCKSESLDYGAENASEDWTEDDAELYISPSTDGY